MRECLHHMIFHRRNTDTHPFVNLPIAEFVDPVHQENAARLWRHRLDGLFVETQEVGRFETLFLFRRAGRIVLLAKRKEQDIVAPVAAGPVDQQILGDPAQKASRIDETMPLGTAGGACEDVLHQIGRRLFARTATKEAQQCGAMPAEGIVEAFPFASGGRCLSAVLVGIARSVMAGRSDRKGMTLCRGTLEGRR